MVLTAVGQEERREETLSVKATTDVDKISSQLFEGSVDISKTPVDGKDSNCDDCGDGYHGPFCGFSYWLFRIHRRWKLGKDQLEPIWVEAKVRWALRQAILVRDGKQGGVLSLPLEKFVQQGAVLRIPVNILRQLAGDVAAMDNYTWRPPWLEEYEMMDILRQHAREVTEMDTYTWRPPWLENYEERTIMDRKVEIERVKRKPPWRLVAVE